LNYAIGEHLENAGVHSGDATVILPAQKLYVNTIRQVKRYSAAIAHALQITDPFNIKFMAKGNEVQVIECNLRASRTVPFVSKTLNHNFVSLATKAMVGFEEVTPYKISLLDIDYVCVKAPMFSFTRLRGADPQLGVEMASTGEVACFGVDAHEAFLKAMLATGFKLPNRSKGILLSIANEEYLKEFADSVQILSNLGFELYGTPGTAAFYKSFCDIQVVTKPKSDDDYGTEEMPSVLHIIKQKLISLVINISEGYSSNDQITSGYIIRRYAVDFGVGLITNVKCAVKLIECLDRGMTATNDDVMHIGEFYQIPMMGWSSTT